MFIGRTNELNELMQSYNSVGANVFELYAPVNAGKTALLEEFCRNKDTIYFTAADESGRANLARFSELVLSHYVDTVHKPFILWSEALRYISDRQEGRRIIIVFDSLDELTYRDSAFMDMLCRCISSDLKGSNMFIILSGRRKMLSLSNERLLQKITISLRLSKFILTDDVVENIKAGMPETSAKAKVFRISEDDVILREGEVNTEMYKILAGKAVMYFGYGTDDEYAIGTLKDGQCFGEYSLLTEKTGIYTVVAFTDMLLMRIGRDEFSSFVEMNANNAVEIMQNMAKMINVLKINIDMLREESGGKS